jgi:hypothetical protein
MDDDSNVAGGIGGVSGTKVMPSAAERKEKGVELLMTEVESRS